MRMIRSSLLSSIDPIIRLQTFLRTIAAAGREVVRVPPFTATFASDDSLKYLNYAIPDDGAEPDAAAIEQLREAFRAHERLPRLEWIEEAAPRVAEALGAAGMEEELRTPLMACAPDDLVEAEARVEKLTVAPVGPDDLREATDIMRIAFGGAPLAAGEGSPAWSPPQLLTRPSRQEPSSASSHPATTRRSACTHAPAIAESRRCSTGATPRSSSRLAARRGAERCDEADQRRAGREPEGERVAGLGCDLRPRDRAGGEHRGRNLPANHASDRPHDRVQAARDPRLGRPDGVDDELGHGGERERRGAARDHHSDDELPGTGMKFGHPRRSQRGRGQADGEWDPVAHAPADYTAERARKEAEESAGQQEETGVGGARSEAVVNRPRTHRLDEDRNQEEGTEEGEPDEERGQVREQHGPLGHHPHVDQRLGPPQLHTDPGGERGDGYGEERKRPGRRPPPLRSLAHPEQEGDEHDREQSRTGEIEPRACLDRRLGHEQDDGNRGRRDDDGGDPEQPPPREMVDDHARKREAEPSCRPEDGRDEPDCGPGPLSRELVPDDRERKREDSAPGALDDPERDQGPDVPGGGASDASDQEDGQADRQQSLLPVLVAELGQ